MPFTVKPITPSFAAEILDIDLAVPLDPATFRALDDAFNRYAVLVFRDQHISDDQHQAFGKHWGPLETSVGVLRKDQKLRLPPTIADVSNLDHKGELVGKNDRRVDNEHGVGHGHELGTAEPWRQLVHQNLRTIYGD